MSDAEFSLLTATAKLFSNESMIQYNLACYCAKRDVANKHLGKSYELGDARQIKLVALIR